MDGARIARSVQILDRDEIRLDFRMPVGELRSQDIGMGLQSLVGVNRQHPLAAGVAQRGVPGGRKGVLPFAFDNRGPRLAGNLHRAVVRAGVVDHDLVDRVPDRFQAGTQHLLLVLDDQASGEQDGLTQRVRTPLLLESDLILELGHLPVDLVRIKRGMAAVVDERPVRNEQPKVVLVQPSAQVVVLESADLEALVESANRPEGRGTHRETESNEPLFL